MIYRLHLRDNGDIEVSADGRASAGGSVSGSLLTVLSPGESFMGWRHRRLLRMIERRGAGGDPVFDLRHKGDQPAIQIQGSHTVQRPRKRPARG